jgi:aryl-alcohol dehydrogenase-like predicted oxidoreductase
MTIGHADDLGHDYEIAAMEGRCHQLLDAAWAAGIRWIDAARSYGRAEEFLASWLRARALALGTLTVSSKWGYTYTAGWRTDAAMHEVKDHSRAALDRQWAESQALLGAHLSLYQIHSATLETGVLDDASVLGRLAELRAGGFAVGLSLSGPRQRQTLERALELRVDGQPLFSAVQATWNLLERAVAPALRAAKTAGWRVLIKEALANGRLTARGRAEELAPLLAWAARARATPDAVALAAALAQPFVDVVLSSAATPAQLTSNLGATAVDGTAAAAQLETMMQSPERYWGTRAQLLWT